MLKDYFEVPNKPAIKSGNILSCDFTDHETFIPQPLDYSRGTIATYVDCNGLVKMSGVSDIELITNGDFVTDSDWTKGTGTTISGGKANFTSATGVSLYQNIGTQSGIVKVTFSVTDYTSGILNVYSGGNQSVGTTNVQANAIGQYTVYVDRSGGNNNIIFGSSGSNNFTGSIDNVSVKEVDVNTARIDYTTEIGKAKELQKPSLLLEPQSTNLITFSDDFSQWTVDGEASISSDSIISPEGIQNSDKLIAGTTSGRQAIKFSISKTGNLAFSIFAKKGEYSVIQLSDARDGSAFANFNLDTGVVGNSNVYTASIVDMGNGWYRCKITWNASFDILAVRVGIVTTPTSARVENFAGNGSDGLYIYGAQLEQQSYATSYIPTSGSTVTRNQDLANNAGQLGVFNNEEGVLYAEMASLANSGVQRKLSISDGTNQKVVVLQFTDVNNQLRAFLYNGALQVNTYNVLSKALEFNKIAFKFKQDDFSLYVNGSEVATDSSGTTFSTGDLTQFNFNDGGISDPFHARIREIKVFRRALTDSELQELTNNIV